MSVPPDEARFTVSITRDHADPKRALSRVNSVSGGVLRALAKAGLADKDIRTSQVTVVPRTVYSEGRSKTVGYRGQVTVDAKTRKLSSVGELMGAAVEAGATKVTGPRFSVSLENPARQDALVEAVKDARLRAEAMAREAGVRLAGIQTIEQAIQVGYAEDPYGYGVRHDAAIIRGPGFATFPYIRPGETELTARVKVVWELK